VVRLLWIAGRADAADRSKISMSESQEVRHWLQHLASREQLQRAVALRHRQKDRRGRTRLAERLAAERDGLDDQIRDALLGTRTAVQALARELDKALAETKAQLKELRDGKRRGGGNLSTCRRAAPTRGILINPLPVSAA
jgi:hypothetical protein